MFLKALVTGATGFVGSHLTRLLAKRGHEVRVTYREKSRLASIEGFGIEPIKADITDIRRMRRAAKGCDVVFHVAGYVGSRPRKTVWEMNAKAPEVVCRAAVLEGVGRMVLTSSVAGIGPAPEGEIGDERLIYKTGSLGLTYVDAKHEGEARAQEASVGKDIDLVIVNPSYVLGPEDPTGTSTRIIGNYLLGKVPGVVDADVNIVDVDDVAKGHILAARRGRPGERYILGGHNIHWAEVIEEVARVSGVHYPVVVVPPEAALVARLRESIGLYMPIAAEGLELMRQNWRYSSAKAKRELGYKTKPLKETIKRTVDWYLEQFEAAGGAKQGRSPLGVLSSCVRAADRARLLSVLRLAERATGRRLVID